MKKVFLDTNIWLRFFLRDNNQFENVEKLISAIEEGKFLPYTSAIVFLEITFVLQKTYGFSKEKLSTYLGAIRETRNMTIIEKTDSTLALHYFRKYGIKFSDCLIASQIPQKMHLITYDKEFSKIKELSIKTPRACLETVIPSAREVSNVIPTDSTREGVEESTNNTRKITKNS